MIREASRSLGVARIALGTVFVFRTTPLANCYPSPLCWVQGPLFGWPVPGWHAAWLGLALPPLMVACLCVIRTAAAVLFTLGIATRAAGLTASLCGLAVLAQDTFSFSFTRYLLFVGTGLLAIADGGGALALLPAPVQDARASLLLVRSFVASIYAWSAIAKLHPAWLTGRTIGALHAGQFLRGSLIDFVTRAESSRVAASISIVVVEMSLGPLLLARRTRAVGLAAALIMHALYELSAQPDVMGLVMLSLLSAFLPLRAHPSEEAQRAPPHLSAYDGWR
jgi:hypothetical protein